MLYQVPTVQDIAVEGRHLCGLAWLAPLLWFSDAALQQILAVDPRTGETVRRIDCPEVRTGLTTIGGHLLQVAGPNRSLREIDPETGKTVRELASPRSDNELCGIEAAGESVWLGYKSPPVLDLCSWPGLERLDSIPVNQEVAGVTVTDRFVAFANYPRSSITLLDPATRQAVLTFGVDGNPTGLTWDGHLLWYCDYTHVQLRAVQAPGAAAQHPAA